MSRISPPSKGCFQMEYPNLAWQKAICAAPTSGHESPSSTVGNGNDYVAQFTSTIIGSAIGSFSSITGLTSETDVCVGPSPFCTSGGAGSNAYSLQVNTQGGAPGQGFPVTFNGWTGTGWQQFIFDNEPSGFQGVWIEYWLLDYLATHSNCPGSVSQNPSDGGPWFGSGSNCVWNTGAMTTPYEQPSSLSQLSFGGFANLAGQDEAILCVTGGSCYTKSEPATVLNLYQHWGLAEFNVVGFIDGSRAEFNTGTSITVVDALADENGNAITPSIPCPNNGQTGETNNLNLGDSGSCLSVNSGEIAFTESNLASWVTVAAYSDDFQFKGQNPGTLTDLHGDILNNYQNQAGLTTYLFSAPTNTQITLSISQAPNGWSFTDDWDDYGFSQYLGFSSLTINVGTSDHKVAAFFTYIATFLQSGIPSGVTWGVTVGGTRYTTSTSGIELNGLDGTVSYSFDSIVTGTSGTQYSCISQCSGSVSGPTTVTATYEAVPTTTQTSTSTSTSTTSTTTSSFSTFLTTTTTTSVTHSTLGQPCTTTSTTQTTTTLIQNPATTTTTTTASTTTTTGTATFITITSSTKTSTTITTATLTICTQTSTSTSTSTTLTTFIRPSTSISLTVAPSSVAVGSSVTLSGMISPNPQSVGVTISFSRDSGATWVTLMSIMTDISGRYSTGWTPPAPANYLLMASWSGNNQLAPSQSSSASLTVTGSVQPTPTVLLSAPSTTPHGQALTLSITVFNPTSSALNSNVTIEITGPNNYVLFDVVQVKVGVNSQSTGYYDWAVPSQIGTYSIMLSLMPPTPSGVDLETLQVT